jgi:hypothetical protein
MGQDEEGQNKEGRMIDWGNFTSRGNARFEAVGLTDLLKLGRTLPPHVRFPFDYPFRSPPPPSCQHFIITITCLLQLIADYFPSTKQHDFRTSLILHFS